MIKTRIVEVVPQADNVPPVEKELGFTLLAEPVMPRGVPTADSSGRMPPPIMITIQNVRFFVIGYTFDVPGLGTDEEPSESVYVLIVQRAPSISKSGLVKADAGALDKIRAAIPAPGATRQ